MMEVSNAENILIKMAGLLEESGVIKSSQKQQSPNHELNDIAISLVKAADQLDMIGEEVVVSHLDKALEKLACAGCHIPENVEIDEISTDANLVIKAASTALIKIADLLDYLDYDASKHVDSALIVLAGKCRCDCKKCKCGDHCNDDSKKCC
jgi:hypothetical protein